MNSDQWVIILCVLFSVCAITLFVVRRYRNQQNPFKTHAKASSRQQQLSGLSRKPGAKQYQSCSYCKRKVNPKELAFYSGPGKVIGVCKSCKPQAERQSLLSL